MLYIHIYIICIYTICIYRERGKQGVLKTHEISLVDIADTEGDVGVDFLCVNTFLMLCPRTVLALPSPPQIRFTSSIYGFKRVNFNMLLKAIITFFLSPKLKSFYILT